jgi:hypothetical protein
MGDLPGEDVAADEDIELSDAPPSVSSSEHSEFEEDDPTAVDMEAGLLSSAEDWAYESSPSRLSSVEVAIPELPLPTRDEYKAVYSEVVDHIESEVEAPDGAEWYHVEFRDGRHNVVCNLAYTSVKPRKAA